MYCNAVKSTCLKLCLDFSSVTACYASSHRWLPVVAVMSHAIPYSAPHPPASRDKLNTCFRERFAISLPHYFGLGYGIRRGTNMRLRCVFALQTADAAGVFFSCSCLCFFVEYVGETRNWWETWLSCKCTYVHVCRYVLFWN